MQPAISAANLIKLQAMAPQTIYVQPTTAHQTSYGDLTLIMGIPVFHKQYLYNKFLFNNSMTYKV